MSWIVCREFSHTTKYCKMFYIVITLGWHSQIPMSEFLLHVILISTGAHANLTLGNWDDLSRRCCPLWPNSLEVMPGKTGSHLQLRSCTVNHVFLVYSASWVYLFTHKVLLFSSIHFCKLSKESYFHNVNISLCFDTFFSSLKGLFRAQDLWGTFGYS